LAEASVRNKDSSHASTAHKSTLDISHTVSVAAVLARFPSSNSEKGGPVIMECV
jgi:hypothetical protein